jgi:hypothetical protein
VIASYYPRLASLSPHRDEKPVTASPLESALTNCDARNPFRMRSYENCRVAYPHDSISRLPSLCRAKGPSVNPLISMRCALFHFPYPVNPVFATLTKTPGVCPNSSHSGTGPGFKGRSAASWNNPLQRTDNRSSDYGVSEDPAEAVCKTASPRATLVASSTHKSRRRAERKYGAPGRCKLA